MFDGLDVMPLCIAPFLAIIVGFSAFAIGAIIKLIIEKKTGKKRDWLGKLIVLLSLLIIPSTCIMSVLLNIGSAVPTPWLKPSTGSISGQWVLSKCTAQRFQERWNGFFDIPRSIEFKRDKTFIVENLPALWGLSDQSKSYDGKYISGSGTWYMKQSGGRIGGNEWLLYAEFQEINQLEDHRLLAFYFNGHLPPYNLAYAANINSVILTQGWISLEDYICPQAFREIKGEHIES